MPVTDGHRIIEIGCVELMGRRLTGRHFHVYLQPDRDSDEGAIGVHGITDEFLKGKPRFAEVADEFFEFINGAQLIIHNAAFDIGFLDMEFTLHGLPPTQEQIDAFILMGQRMFEILRYDFSKRENDLRNFAGTKLDAFHLVIATTVQHLEHEISKAIEGDRNPKLRNSVEEAYKTYKTARTALGD